MVMKLLHQCEEELSKFSTECSSLETWLMAAEQKVKFSHEPISKSETLEQRKAAHEVWYSVFCPFSIVLGVLRRLKSQYKLLSKENLKIYVKSTVYVF